MRVTIALDIIDCLKLSGGPIKKVVGLSLHRRRVKISQGVIRMPVPLSPSTPSTLQRRVS